MAAALPPVVVRLRTIDDLFTPPAITPFDPCYVLADLTSGIDYITAELKRTPRRQPPRVVLLLPMAEVADHPEFLSRTRGAISRHGEARAASERQKRAIDASRRRVVLVIALLFFIVANLVLFTYARDGTLFGLTGTLIDVIVEGLAIAAWVALWWPLDQLFQLMLYRMDEGVYASLQRLDLTIEADTYPWRTTEPPANLR